MNPSNPNSDFLKSTQKQSDLAVFWRLWLLFKPYWGWMFLGILLSLITVMANVMLMALSGWFITSMAIAGLASVSMDYFSPAAGIRGLAIARTASRYGERLITHEATFRVIAQLRHWFYLHLEPLAPAVLQNYHSGDLLSRIRSDIDALENIYIRIIVPVTVAIIASLFFVFFLSRYDGQLAIIEFVLLLIAGVLTPILINKVSKKPAEKKVKLSTELRTNVVDSVQGMGELLIYGAAEKQAQQLDSLSSKLLSQQAKLARYKGVSQAILSICANLAMLGALVVIIPLVTQAVISPPNLVMLTLFTLASFEAIIALPLAFQTLPETLASARRIFSIVDTKPLVSEPESDSPKPNNFDIAFNEVSFAYTQQSNTATASQELHAPMVLDKLSFNLKTGSRLGIVGNSGMGKSSIINLLLRFWEANEGKITFGGHNIADYHGDDIRQYISVVTQEPHFFNSTIKRNLLLANRQATDEKIEEVCKVAQIHDFIQSLPEAYDTWVGEAGFKLSGGQLKRLAIARALLKDTPILILDEPGEGLDSKTERAVLKGIFEYKKNVSILLITHRQTGLKQMDKLLYL